MSTVLLVYELLVFEVCFSFLLLVLSACTQRDEIGQLRRISYLDTACSVQASLLRKHKGSPVGGGSAGG